jgi:hypothetical protein
MSTKETDYEWFTGTGDPLQFPWYDCEAVTFKDPARSSTAPVIDDDDVPEGPSFGPGAGGPPGPQPPSAQGPTTSTGSAESSNSTTTTGGGPAPFNAPPYTTHTDPVKPDASVDITFKCVGRTIATSVKANLKESEIQRTVANVMQMNLDGFWVATVTEGSGRIGALINGSTVTLTPATAEQIQRVVQARTNATSEPKPRKEKTHEPRKAKLGTSSKNWLAIQGSREKQVEWIQFGQELERDKMVHIVTDGGARPNLGAAG